MDQITLPKITGPSSYPSVNLDPGDNESPVGVCSYDGGPAYVSSVNSNVPFVPKETLREPRWFYPFPEGFDAKPGPDQTAEALISYIYNRLGADFTLDILQDALQKLCQSKWRIACKNRPDDPISYFKETIFEINRRTGEDTPESLTKDMIDIMKELKHLPKGSKERSDMILKYHETKAKQEALIAKLGN